MKNIINKLNLLDFLLKLLNDCHNIITDTKSLSVSYKKDGSPVSNIDHNIDKYIKKKIEELDFSLPIISEEQEFSKEDFKNEMYWIVDPIDGTKSFLRGGDEYTVNIALIYKGKPFLGAVSHPPTKKIWLGKENELFVFKNYEKKKLKKITPNWKVPIVISSRYNNKKTEKFINSIKRKEIIHTSSSLKFCLVAESLANLYPRLSVINKWDIAAGHSILSAAGGVVTDLNGKDINYNSSTEKVKEFVASDSRNWLSKLQNQ